jgi:hypothetical protein
VAEMMKKKEIQKNVDEVRKSTWQGLLLKNRYEDDKLSKGCFKWMTDWKNCPVNIINDAQSIYLQTIPTLTFTNYRSKTKTNNSTTCRLCKKSPESVCHLLSSCNKFLPTDYKRRHDRVLQYILFCFLHKNGFSDSLHPWYTKVVIKPKYENEEMLVLWDIPEYSGYEEEEEAKVLRPDGKIVLKKRKLIFVLEMSVPWIDNRESKHTDKEDKYRSIVQSLKIDNPHHKVQQVTFIVDCLGGFSDSFTEALKVLDFSAFEIEKMCLDIQKILISEATSTINKFKVLTKE